MGAEDNAGTSPKDIDLRTFQEVVNGAGHSIYWTDPDGIIEYVNPAFEEQTGYTADEAIGENANLLQSGAHEDEFYEQLWETILSGEIWHGEIINERQNGEQYVVKQTIAPIHDDSGSIERFVAINEDITELRTYQTELERQRDRLSTLIHAIPTPLVFVDLGDRAVVNQVNRAFEETFDIDGDTIVGSDLDEHIVTDQTAEEAEAINEKLKNGESVTREVTRTTASEYSKTFLLEAIPLNDGTEVLGTYTDITEQKRSEEKQRFLTEMSRAIGEAETFEDGLERTLDVICAYTEWAYGEAWRPVSDEDTLEFVVGRTYESDLESFSTTSEKVTFEAGEGLPGRVYTSSSPEWIPDVSTEPEEIFQRQEMAADVGLRAAFGVPLSTNDGVVAVLTFFLEEHSEIDDELMTHVSDVVRSLTGLVERKEYEQRLEEQRDNLEILNQIVRHDIRNNLQLVQAYTELAQEHADDEGREHLETVQQQAEHAIGLTRTARELANVMLQPEFDTEAIPLKVLLQQKIEEIRSSHPDALVSVAGSLPKTAVICTDMLESAVRNILQNAIIHNDKDVAEVTVSASREGDSIDVRIADNGPGIPDSEKEDIFGKGEKGLDSPGTGIGLYLVKTIVEGCAGDVWIEDNDPEGAVFVVRLPTAT